MRSKAQRLGTNGCRAVCSCSPFLFFQQHLSVTVCQVKCVAIILFSFFFVFHESLTLCRSLSCFCHFSHSRYHLPSKMSECIMSPWLLLLWAHFTFIDEFCFECFCWFLVVVFLHILICLLCFQVSDTGQYVCKATNVAGQVDKNFHLNIYGRSLQIFID